jgi:hypothetical protein
MLTRAGTAMAEDMQIAQPIEERLRKRITDGGIVACYAH